MFFKTLFILFLFFPSLSFSEGNFATKVACFTDMKEYYPYLLEGQLTREGQKRFFRCLHDTIELLFMKNMFTRDTGKDYFSKKEIFTMFHRGFEYEKDLSYELTNKIFAIKKLLIGGSIDRLKDDEIKSIYNLMSDYEDIYYILHTQIPIFKKIFNGTTKYVFTPEDMKLPLRQIRNSLTFLVRAYKREKIVYNVSDLYRYDEYLKAFEFFESTDNVKQVVWYLHNLLGGLVSPRKEIRGAKWDLVRQSLYQTITLFFYYKTDFSRNLPFTYKILEGAELFLSSLQMSNYIQPKKKTDDWRELEGIDLFSYALHVQEPNIQFKKNKTFPLKNLTEMLSAALSFMEPSSTGVFQKSLIEGLRHKPSISLLIRALNCFSLNRSPHKKCSSQKGKGNSNPVVTLLFEDLKFEIFNNKMKMPQPVSVSSAKLKQATLDKIQKWIMDYKNAILRTHQGQKVFFNVQRHFRHWSKNFFNWKRDGRIEFGSFRQASSLKKSYQILEYNALIQILFSSYLPKGFFSFKRRKPVSLSFETWTRWVDEMAPVLAIIYGQKGYQISWRTELLDLFYVADSFLYSSNMDNSLSAGELMDLTVHVLEGMKSVELLGQQINKHCFNRSHSCIVDMIIKKPEVLAAYPRFKKQIFNTQKSKYKQRMLAILDNTTQPVQNLDFLPLFLLIQIMELNYVKIDQNQSFYLESNELLGFAKKFEEQIVSKIPYILNKEQARSYLMYSFYTGDIPFFTGDSSTLLNFTNWHLNPESRQSFKIPRHKFHFLIFDFYKIYKQ